MKQFFKTMFASTLGVLIAVGILIVCSVGFIIGITTTMNQTTEFKPDKNTIFKISLKGTLVDQEDKNPFGELLGESNHTISLSKLQKAIRLAKENDNIRGIYLEAGLLNSYPASLKALRNSLLDFKESGKFIYAYGDTYTQGEYYVCSVADSIFLNPQGSLFLLGLRNVGVFFTGLTDKIGIEYYVFKAGTFKSAVEPYILKEFSEENREQIESFQQVIWSEITTGICQDRTISLSDIESFTNEGLALGEASKTVEFNLVDELLYKTEVEERLKSVVNLENTKKLKFAGIEKITSIKEKKNNSKNQIAILFAEGIISDTKTSPLAFNEKRITNHITKELRRLKDDKDIKAVVFRINTPGGSAYLSEQIWKEVVELKKEKPLVVSMGDMATSGGYYISCAANKIIAEPTTYTGSIGVFNIVENRTRLFDKIGLSVDVVKTNSYADLGNMGRPMQEDEKILFQKHVDHTYDLFITRCAEGRGLEKTFIDSVGQGRVWTGKQALNHGLIDRLGSIDVAIEEAVKIAGLDDYKVITVSNNKDFFTEFLEKQLDHVKGSIIKNTLGKEYKIFETIHQMEPKKGLQAVIPYEIQPM